jgi:putative ABC transport system substrate-binding protein
MADPVGDELVANLARPGGNITGTTFIGPELIAKCFGLLKDAISGLSRIAALWHPVTYGKRTMESMLSETETAAQAFRLQVQMVPAISPADLDDAFVTMTREHADAVIQLPSPMLHGEHKRIVEWRRRAGSRQCTPQGSLWRMGA